MEVTGKLKMIGETVDVGTSGFQKRDCVVTTNEQYEQHILVQFVQDKCNLLANFRVGEEVRIDINLKGREWVNKDGETVYFNTIQGWKITSLQPTHQHQGTATAPTTENTAQTQTNPAQMGGALPGEDEDGGDLPF